MAQTFPDLPASESTIRDFVDLIAQLVPHAPDRALPDFIDMFRRTMEQRQTTA